MKSLKDYSDVAKNTITSAMKKPKHLGYNLPR